MDNYQSEAILKLAHAELSMGNYSEAENYFKKAIEQSNSPLAWLGLGSARLAFVFNSKNINSESSEKLINSAFTCFTEAKRIDPNNAELLENKLLATSFNHLKVYFQRIKNSYDQYKNHSNTNSQLMYLGLAAALFKNDNINNTIGNSYLAINEQKNLAAIQINLSIQTANHLKTKTIAFIEYAIDGRNTFIREISALEHETQWYITDEKEKKRIFLEQEAAKKQKESSVASSVQKESEITKFHPAILVALIVVTVLIIIRLLQFYIAYSS